MTVPEVVMAAGFVLIALAVGYLVWKSHRSPSAPSARVAIDQGVESVLDWYRTEYAALKAEYVKLRDSKDAAPPATADPTLSPAPVQATPVAGWALGTSYTSPAALLADVARPDFPPVRIDGEQKAGVTGFDFYTLADGSVSQTKPV